MILGSHRASADLGSLEPGTHLCALERDATVLDRVAATFVGQGLAAGDQLLYVVADGFRLAARQAHKRGFPGLRVAARMDELAGWLGSMDEVVVWERMATGLQRELQVSSVCLYDTHRLEAGEGATLAREHDGLAPDIDVAPIATFLAVDEPWGVQVRGEVDVSNRHLLHRLVLSRAAVTPRLRLDLHGVTFADACPI